MGLTYLFENLVITKIRPETNLFAEMIVQATQGIETALKEFPKFKIQNIASNDQRCK